MLLGSANKPKIETRARESDGCRVRRNPSRANPRDQRLSSFATGKVPSRNHTGPRIRPPAGPRTSSSRCPWLVWVSACGMVMENKGLGVHALSIGEVGLVAPNARCCLQVCCRRNFDGPRRLSVGFRGSYHRCHQSTVHWCHDYGTASRPRLPIDMELPRRSIPEPQQKAIVGTHARAPHLSSNRTGNTNDLGSFPGARRTVLHAEALTPSARRDDFGLPARWRIRLCGDRPRVFEVAPWMHDSNRRPRPAAGQFNLALGSIGLAIGIGATVSASLAGSTADRRGRPTAFVGLAAAELAATMLA
jgi:hypothetical protein